jgi:hypothetical protein
VQLQVPQAVLVFQILLMLQRRLADIDRYHPGGRVRKGKDRRLIGAATGDQDVEIGFVFAIGP